MLSDIALSRHSTLLEADALAVRLDIPSRFVHPYGRHMAKIDPALLREPKAERGKLILVSAITPTPFGEGKTVTTLGLSMGLNRRGASSIACVRQPSLGPVFGVKGGAAGGGHAQVVPMEAMNLHLTGDIHAVGAAHNLAAAALDARLYHERKLGDDFTAQTGLPRLNIGHILWPRVVDMNDRALRRVTLGLGDETAVERQGRFIITAASELMAILALASDLHDLRARIGRVRLAEAVDGSPITAEDLEVAGAMTALLKQAIAPTLMQTSEQTPVLVHAGPFANIAHGNSSVIADRIALRHADYVVTEAGFGTDMGLEKFFHIKARQSGLQPACVVLVATLRGIKANSGAFDFAPGQRPPAELTAPNQQLLELGMENLRWHIGNARRYGMPVVVALNRFPEDGDEELNWVMTQACLAGARSAALSEAFAKGGAGATTLADAVIEAAIQGSAPRWLYPSALPLRDKLTTLAERGYGASGVHLSDTAKAQLEMLSQQGLDHLSLCMAKTPLSISHDPALKGVPTGFILPVEALVACTGAGFIYVLCGPVMTMPGLGSLPGYRHIDIDEHGDIIGLS
ncbi:formate--tetrahydrofolate ligase [Aeromonas simiae]|uniref:formate--tetrahydrofolate ligase n=1 Tax=Aeromonas simiae TaxID=218936 RepID=UPI00266C2E1E|nr:formate--tetrahydrofolate ligase [Aeromonas simiae]MDO2948766.1 formate--tetrahydrofolate ligase [Aeromonas simiae]MDO2956149.1 formate--tetrahydrofolate ligase [Aeromonas simiae]